MKQLMFFVCIAVAPSLVNAREIEKSLFKGYDTAWVIRDRTTGAVVNPDPSRSARRLPPCSTFKIYNTLIGLELGLLQGPDVPWYKWDGVHRAIDGWNQDLTLRQAFGVSAVPAFQALARQTGAGRMRKYIEQIGYGTKDISDGLDSFWLYRPGPAAMMISADEQVALLNDLFDGKLPFSQDNIATLKDIMRVAQTEKGTLYGKTGSGMNADGKWALGWFVGFLENDGGFYVFACNITGGEEPSGRAARSIVQDILTAQGLM